MDLYSVGGVLRRAWRHAVPLIPVAPKTVRAGSDLAGELFERDCAHR